MAVEEGEAGLFVKGVEEGAGLDSVVLKVGHECLGFGTEDHGAEGDVVRARFNDEKA